jgi:hypothetical protein
LRNVYRFAPYVTLFALGLWQGWIGDPVRRAITLDNQCYVYVAERVAAGVPPYVSFVDHKHALSAMLSGWAMLVGRAFDADDVYSARVLSVLLAATLPAALWMVALRLTRRPIVAHVTGFLALCFSDFFAQAAMGFRPQLFMAVFMVYSFAALGARRHAIAGAAAIASFLCWQPALVVFASSCVAIALERSSRRALARYAVAGLAVCLLYESYFWYHGALRDQLFQSYVLPSNLAGYEYKPLWDGIEFILRDGVWSAGWWYLVPMVYLATLAVVVLEPLVRWRAVWARLRADALPGALSAVAVSSFAFTLLDHQSFPDRYFLQPFIALANGLTWGLPLAWLCEAVVGADQRGRGARVVSAAVFATATYLTVTHPPIVSSAEPPVTLAKQRELANRTAALRRQYGPLWAIGCPHLLALRRTANYDSISLVIDPKVRDYMKSMAGEDGYRPRSGTMPVVMLTSRGGEGIAFPWLRREYWPVRDQAFEAQDIHAWLRKDCLVDRSNCRVLFECAVRPRCLSHAGLAR